MPVSGGRLCLSCTLAVAKPSSRPSFLPWTTRPLMLYGRPSSASAAASSPPASAARTAELDTGAPGRRRPRREEFPRMRLERQHATDQSAPACLADEALEHRPVPEVNAVEIAHGQRDRWQRGVGSAVGKQHEAG